MKTSFDLAYASSMGGLLLLELFVIATAILILAAVLVYFSKNQSAAFRHQVWTLSMAAILVLPLCAMVLPHFGPRWPVFSGDVGGLDDDIVAGESLSNRPGSEGRWNQVTERTTGNYGSFVPTSETATINEDERNSASPENPLLKGTERRLYGSTSFDHTAMKFMTGLTLLWLLGVTGKLFLLAGSWISAHRIVRRAVPVANGATLALMAEKLRRSNKLRYSIPLYCSPEICVPQAIGILRPSVLVPTGYGKWTADRCRVVLAHEMAHIRRQDVLCQLIARLACCLYWYHPLVWVAHYRIRIEREFACDDAVLENGANPKQYADHLLAMTSMIGNKAKAIPNAIAMSTFNDLEGRVLAILDPSLKRSAVSRDKGSILAAATLTVIVFLCLICPSKGQRASASQQAGGSSKSSPIAELQDKDTTNHQEQRQQAEVDPDQKGETATPLFEPIIGKGFIIVPFLTELQRATNGGHEKAALFMLINGDAVLNDDNTIVDTSQLDLDGIEDAMVSYFRAGMDFKGKHVVTEILRAPRKKGGEDHRRLNASALLRMYFVNAGWTNDPQQVSVIHLGDYEPSDWDDLVAELAVPPTAAQIHAEAGIGDDLVRVHSIHTPLSRYLFDTQGENVVVRNMKPLADLSAEEIEILPARAKGFIDQLDLSEPPRTRFIKNFGFPISKGNRANAKLQERIEAHGLATRGLTLWSDGASRKTPSLKISVLGIDDTPIEDAKITVEYPPEVLEYHHGLSPVQFERRDDGRWYSSGLAGDEEFTLTIEAPGYEAATQKLSRPYNTTYEIEVKLRKQ